jgi:hypothetical protein
MRKLFVGALVALTAFLALTAFAGGVGLVTGLNAPPAAMLRGGIFRDFTIPGVALFVLVGGSALFAFVLLVRGSRYGAMSAAVAGFFIMFFEFVEVQAIGTPPGPGLFLQLCYFGLGSVIIALALMVWYVTLRGSSAVG